VPDPFDGGDSPYAGDWSAGAFAPPGVIWVGEIPLPVARELVDQGWTVVGQPLPPLDSGPERTLPDDPGIINVPGGSGSEVELHDWPDTVITPDMEVPPPGIFDPDQLPYPFDLPQPIMAYAGGPEDTQTPVDFDIPLPGLEVPNVPATQPPPLEGELVGPDVVYHDYEGYDQLPGYDYAPPRRIIEGERIWERGIWTVLGRIAGGPVGSVIRGIGVPETLGSGQLPFPPIPAVILPFPPPITFPEPTSPPTPDPYIPGFQRPDVPEVITVTPPAPAYTPQPTRSSQTVPSTGTSTRAFPWPLVGALVGLLIGRHPPSRGFPVSDPLTLNLTDAGTATLGSAPPAPIPPPTLTQEQQCDCSQCSSRGKKRKKPRKCRTRAPVRWAGGPKSGQLAGTRCVKFEDSL
jgi:hypothetical protein